MRALLWNRLLWVSAIITAVYGASALAVLTLAPAIQTAYGLQSLSFGLLAACPMLGQTVVSLRAGRWIDQWGSRPVAVGGMFGAAMALAGAAQIPSLPFLVGSWLLIGMGAGVAFAAAASALGNDDGNGYIGRRTAIRQMAIPLGIAIASPLLIAAEHSGGLPAAFWLLAALSLSAAFIAYTGLPATRPVLPSKDDSPHKTYWLYSVAISWSLVQTGLGAFFVLYVTHELQYSLATAAIAFTSRSNGRKISSRVAD
jgi:MFS family permease